MEIQKLKKKKKNSCPHISQANGGNYVLTAERVHITSNVTLFSLLSGFPFMFVTLLFNTGLCKWLHFASSINGISPGAKWNKPDPCSFDATLMVQALHFQHFKRPVQFSSVLFSRSVVSDSLQPHESQHARPPFPSPTPRVYSNSCPSSQ